MIFNQDIDFEGSFLDLIVDTDFATDVHHATRKKAILSFASHTEKPVWTRLGVP